MKSMTIKGYAYWLLTVLLFVGLITLGAVVHR